MISRLLIIIFFCFNATFVYSQDFLFQTKKIEIYKNENKIIASDGKALSNDGDLEIEADKFEYDETAKVLKIIGNGKIKIKSENLEFTFDNSIIDKKRYIVSTIGKTKIKIKNKNFLINSSLISYDKNKNILSSDEKTIIIDELNNYYQSDNFYYEIKNDVIKFKNLTYKDKKNNIFNTSLAFVNVMSSKFFGKDIKLDLYNSINEQNDYRLRGNSFYDDAKFTQINKGVFTNCKKREGCPPWKLSAKRIQHDKEKKQINYKDAKLFFYDMPILYFPKFFHPDPTVKRQSGFLIPSFNNSKNSANYFSIPYYFVVAENKDFTISPRIYSNNNFLLQTEFRQKNFSSNHVADISFFRENSEERDNHIFYDYNKIIDLENFENSQINFKFQKSSTGTYLKKNKIKSDLIEDFNNLKNSVDLNLSNENLMIEIEASVYEDLTKNDHDKHEYIFPKVDLTKKMDNNTQLDGNFYFTSKNLIRNYNTNIYESSNVNELMFSSFPKISSAGFWNNYEFNIKNANTKGKKSNRFKNKESAYLSGLLQLNSSLPLIKTNSFYKQALEPKLSLKMAPRNTKNYTNEDKILDINNLYSLDRLGINDTIEGGLSLTYGTSYTISNNYNNNDFFKFRVANNLRLKENNDIDDTNELNKKMSNIFSEAVITPNKNLEISYNSAIKNNLSDLSNESIIAKINISNFNFLFDYSNENSTAQENSYLSKSADYKFNESNYLVFSTREDKAKDLTEFYKLVYQYKNDCLSASIEYNKEFYTDRDIGPEENIFFKLSIIPFGEASSPNLKY